MKRFALIVLLVISSGASAADIDPAAVVAQIKQSGLSAIYEIKRGADHSFVVHLAERDVWGEGASVRQALVNLRQVTSVIPVVSTYSAQSKADAARVLSVVDQALK